MVEKTKPSAFGKSAANTESFLIANENKTFIKHLGRPGRAKLSRQLLLRLCPSTVIDKETLSVIQVLQLHEAVDHTRSATGSALLLRSLIQPSTDLDYLRSRQESLKEIASNDKLRDSLENGVNEFGAVESALYKFFNKGLYAIFPYQDLKSVKKAGLRLIRALKGIPRTESFYLDALLARLHSYEGSSIHRMTTGPIYWTFGGLKSEREVGFFTPKFEFIPRRFSRWILAGPAIFLSPHVAGMLGFQQVISPLMPAMGLVLTAIYALYGLIIKPIRDTEKFIEPLRKKCVYDIHFNEFLEAWGRLDEMLSWNRFAAESVHPVILPEVTDQRRHCFEAEGLRNPVLAKSDPDFTPNRVQMNGARLTFISGPNSGGKTTICKSIVHNQLLAQAGAYVLAEKAAVGIADNIRYQAPKFDGLQDDEGRFGSELARTRDIFYTTTPKSLVVLDELAEGTTIEEKMHESYGILNDFCTIGNNTILVTHNHALVDQFLNENKGQSLMAEFIGDDPSYRIIPGISRMSHAGRIARKINFSKEDRYQYLKKNGYL